jgi:ABC-type dipeptide/oligopeptide/nickel transport system ATPase component/ABC-type dipeptide/oligopeptide/nickel transport system permease subunit
MTTIGDVELVAASADHGFANRFVKQRGGVIGAVVLGLFIMAALLGPLIAPYDANAQDLVSRYGGISAAHWLGTDELGRDVMSRIVVGARVDIAAAAGATVLAWLIGVPLGLLVGFAPKKVDLVVMRIVESVQALPAIIVITFVIAVVGRGITGAVIALGIALSLLVLLVTRSEARLAREELYTASARVLGVRSRVIVTRHIFPNIVPTLIAITTTVFGICFIALSGLSVLGLGVTPPDPSWGAMLQRAATNMGEQFFSVFPPGLAILAVGLSTSAVTDGIRASLGRSFGGPIGSTSGLSIRVPLLRPMTERPSTTAPAAMLMWAGLFMAVITLPMIESSSGSARTTAALRPISTGDTQIFSAQRYVLFAPTEQTPPPLDEIVIDFLGERPTISPVKPRIETTSIGQTVSAFAEFTISTAGGYNITLPEAVHLSVSEAVAPAPSTRTWPKIVGPLAVLTGVGGAAWWWIMARRRRRAQRLANAPTTDATDPVPRAFALVTATPRPINDSSALRLEGLYVSVHTREGALRPIVKGVDLTVARREILGLVGESGSGKTMTASAIAGLLPVGVEAHATSVEVAGVDLRSLEPTELRRMIGTNVGMVFQNPLGSLNPTRRVGSQLAESVRVHTNMSKNAAAQKVLELLGAVGMADPRRVADSHPFELSGGMAQRVMIASALMSDPVLLLADEPTTALDVTIQAQVLDLLHRVREDFGTGILFITHDLAVVADLCDSVAVMQRGEIVERGSVREVFTSPKDPYTRLLLTGVAGVPSKVDVHR